MISRSAWMFAQSNVRTYFEWVRLEAMDQWWHWLVLAAVVGAILASVVAVYRRDSSELPRATRWLLCGLRLAAFAGLLLFFLQLEKRTEQQSVHHSRLMMMIDTSQSMGLTDETSTATDRAPSRLQQVVDTLSNSSWLQELRAKHDVVVYRFDQDERPEEVAVFAHTGPAAGTATDPEQDRESSLPVRLEEARRLYAIAAILLSAALLAAIAHLALGRRASRRASSGAGESWALLISVLSLMVALVFGAVAHLRNPDITLSHALGTKAIDESQSAAQEDSPSRDEQGAELSESADSSDEPQPAQIDWQDVLQPRGVQTRIGDALRAVIDKERGGPIAGVVVISDGNQNAGRELAEAIARAKDAEIPVYTIGMGSSRRPQNLRLADVEAPPRVFPGDSFRINSFIQAFGLEGRSAKLELLSRPAEADQQQGTGVVLEERRVNLAADGQMQTQAFEVEPQEAGKFVYTIRVSTNESEIDTTDNERAVTVQFVDRKTRVLLLAGGPTREYRFVRNQYFRDPQVELHVVLQSSPAGAAQEADEVLDGFPDTLDAMFSYDAVLAFDPNWDLLEPAQIELLERWVAENAGGLVFVAGGVHMPEWTGRRRTTPALDTILGLYPVSFYSQSAQSLSSRLGSTEDPWPLEFTEEGARASYLALGDDANSSQRAWLEFPGVYGYFPVRAPKPGATVLARFSNPETQLDNQLPVYMASQFYGAGRVFYLGSGELWRLRAIDAAYFEQFYTKLLRYVSEGRLLRDSNRGLLLVGKDRATLGEVVTVRAVLQDAQHRPLTDEQVDATLVDPAGARIPLPLKLIRETSQEGTYTGQFIGQVEGRYRVELVLPQSNELEILEREVQVRIPELEVENPQRNDAVLGELARATGGKYYVGLTPAVGGQSTPPLAAAVVPQSQVTFLPSIPDQQFEQSWMGWLMVLICGTLSLEWLIRRVHRLA